MHKIVIFLDFDGVLHPQPSPRSQLFQGVPLLADALRRYPTQLDLVISSSWRETDTMGEMRARFPEDIRSLIIDTTPVFSDMPQKTIESMLPTSWESLDLDGKRQREIELWLKQQRPSGVPWIAIDDDASNFTSGCQNLLLTNGRKGIQPNNIQTLHAMLRERLIEL